jgi:5'-methylthioadenosine phosphorylase
MGKQVLGIVGGSGLYEIEGLEKKEFNEIDTPFGKPSGPYLTGVLDGTPMVFLPRHGPAHSLLPSEINYRANIHGFRQLGVRHLVSVSAVGSLKEDIHPGDMVIPTQFFDRTKDRQSTFFGDGVVGHVPFGDPVCPVMVEALTGVMKKMGVRHHRGGTYVCMEGPAYSTRAESEFYRNLGMNVIGMTNLPEAKLAREAEMCYATLALSTDYDCWHQTEENVSADAVLQTFKKNISVARKAIRELASKFPLSGPCACQRALEGSLVTAPEHISPASRDRLRLLMGRFFK